MKDLDAAETLLMLSDAKWIKNVRWLPWWDAEDTQRTDDICARLQNLANGGRYSTEGEE